MQLTAPSAELELVNRELGTVESIDEGHMAFRMDDGRSIEADPAKHSHLDHGYAVTSHSSQGQTAAECFHVDTQLGAKDLLNNRMPMLPSRVTRMKPSFYNNRSALGAALGRDVSHKSAHTSELVQGQAVPQPEIVPAREHSCGFGIDR